MSNSKGQVQTPMKHEKLLKPEEVMQYEEVVQNVEGTTANNESLEESTVMA